MKKAASPYVVSYQAESFYKRIRYHWMVCLAENPEQMVSWGHEPTRELAESVAQKALQDLSSGLTQGGKATGDIKPLTRRIANGDF